MLNKLRNRIAREERGFTLIELLVVVIILGILTAIAIPSYLSFRGRAEDSAAKANLRSLIPSVESFYADNGTYANMTVAGLKASYDQSIDASVYSVGTVSQTTYCVWAKASPTSSTIAYKAGPSAQITVSSTPVCT
jgi:type II secretion system protein G